MYYEFHRCAGPCSGAITREKYAAEIDAACRTLSGDSDDAIQRLTAQCDQHIEALRFERAGEMHQRIRALEYVKRSCFDSALSNGSFAIAAPSHLCGRPVMLLFNNGRLVWKVLASRKLYPDEDMIARHIADLDDQTKDLLPGRPSSDDLLIIMSYMHQRGFSSYIHPIVNQDSAAALRKSLDELARLRRTSLRS